MCENESHSWIKGTAGDIFIKFLRLYPPIAILYALDCYEDSVLFPVEMFLLNSTDLKALRSASKL